MVTSDLLPLDAFYAARAVTVQGDAHRQVNVNNQDHAVALASPEGIVLVVADGVSTARDLSGFLTHSRNEAGAWLTAEVAARAAHAALVAGTDVRQAVAEALHRCLGPLWRELGETRGRQGLACTLLIAVITPAGTRIWQSGDGYFGVIARRPLAAEFALFPGGTPKLWPEITQTFEDRALPGDGEVASIGGAVHYKRLPLTASLHAATSAAEVVSSLTLVLDYPGPVLSAYVATDGLRHEPAAATGLRERVLRQSRQLALTRPKDCDDIAVAWASTHVAGLIADDELDLDQLAAAVAQDLNAGGAS